MRLLLAGAFPYPHAQGSQVYFQEQAIALRAAGAEVELLSYGPGRGPTPDANPRALAGFVHTGIPAWAAPASRRSGPNLGKPAADLCLAARLRRLCAARSTAAASDASSSVSSSVSSIASRDASSGASSRASFDASSPVPATRWFGSGPAASFAGPLAPPRGRIAWSVAPVASSFDAILAHHAEAALAALHGLPGSRPPVVYCAHTLLGEELPSYFGERIGAPGLASLGRVIDRWIARRAEGWIALTQSSARVMAASSAGVGRLIAPPVADPADDDAPLDPAHVAAQHGLVPGRFFLYAGNLDAYQELPLLEAVARDRALRRAQGCGSAGSDGARGRLALAGRRPLPDPIVIATHDERAAALPRGSARPDTPVVLRLRTAAETRALIAAARASVVTRRSAGGFPIKLANSLAAGTPVVAFRGDEWGLESGRAGLVCDPERPVASLADALDRIEADDALAARLRVGARATWSARHAPGRAAAETLALVEEVVGQRRVRTARR